LILKGRAMARSDWGGHALLGYIAYETLPEWEKDLIKPDMSPAALGKPYISAAVKTPADKVAQMCGILDMIYYDECRPYATLPDGRWIPHCPPDANWQASVGSGQMRSPSASVALAELLMTRMIEAIRANDWEDAVRHGGALAHHLQEPFTPGHAVDNSLFHELFPDPDPERHMRLHHCFDAASGAFDPLPPKLMGTTVPEAAFRLLIEIDRGIRQGKKLIWPVIRAVYEGQPADAPSRLLAGQCRMASFATAAAWHTAICIALDRFDEAEAAALERLPLCELVPYFLHAWQYVEILPGHLVREKRKIPIHVWEPTPDGGKAEARIENGFGMGGHMGIKFFVNGDVYPRFRCRVGLPSRHREGQTEHTNARFYVEMDPEVNTVYSEDIEYQAVALAETPLAPGAPVRELEVDLRGARTLILRAQSQSWTDPETGQVAFSIPHVAVCEPVLCKR